MASVQDVFAQMQAEGEETIDSNNYCMLESDTTRKILIPEKYSIFGVESDEKSNRIKFKFPQHVNDIDLSELSLRINYRNANGEIDQNLTENKETTDDRFVTFEWVLTRKVTAYMGDVDFIVCAIKTQPDGTLINEWNTTIATVQTLEGLEPEPVTEEETEQARDLLTQLLSVMLSVKTDSVQAVNNTKDNAITEITQTKTQAISDIKAEGQTQTTAVDAKGAQVLESIPDDYTTLENRVDEIEQNRAYVIVGNGSGEFVTLNDSSELKTRNIKLFGKSVQSETTGTQLFNVNVCKNEADLQYKITIDDYATGKITVSMDNPEGAVAMPVNRLSDYCPTMTSGKTYYLSGKHDGSSNGDISLVDVSDTWDFGTSREITEQDLQSAVKFGFGTYSNIMIVEGSSEKPYEVYTGGEAATEPTPEFPLPITSAGNYDAEEEKYEIGISVDGANLLDYESWKGTDIVRGTGQYINNGVVLTASETDCFTEYSLPDVYKISVLPSTTYVLSWEHSGDSGLVYVFEGTTSNGSFSVNKFVSATDNKLTFTTGQNAKYIRFRVGVQNSGDTATYKNIQLNVGDTPLEFKPFQGTQQKVLQLPNPLRGIPVDSGGNYTDADGQQWICDYIDRERGKYVQCVQEAILDGSEDEAWEKRNSPKGLYLYVNFANRNNRDKTSVCNMFKNFRGGWSAIPNLCFQTVDGAIGIRYENIESVEQLRDFLKNNNLKVLFGLNNYIETDLTPDQLAALNLSTYQGITNIGTDTMPQVGVEVEYGCDTKIYIDNAIAEAIAAIPTE